MSDSQKYNRVAIALHWLLALALLGQLFLGFWMEGVPKEPPGVRAGWFNIHKSIGLILALLIVLRVIWRLMHTPPALPALPAWQKTAANWSHRLLYTCMVLMPLSGFLGSSFTPYPIKFFGTPLPRLWEASADLKELFGAVHTTTGFVMAALVALHIAAAVLHAVRRDGVVQRMSLMGSADAQQS